MTLLGEIQRDAVDESVPITQLLRKCQILAARLEHAPFRDWVAWELTGYPDDVDLPTYRSGLKAHLIAYMGGALGRAIKNQPVPETLLPDWAGNQTSWEMRENVAELQSLVDQSTRSGHTMVHRVVPPEIFSAIPEFLPGFGIMEMKAVLPTTAIAGLLDQVRSRALSFALELEKEAPAAGDTVGGETVAAERVTQIFNTSILGGNVNWATGPHASQTLNVRIQPGDVAGLMARLAELGVEPNDRDDLRSALEADGAAGDDTPGRRTRDWLARLALRTSGDVGKGATGALIARAIAEALGLG